MKQLTLKLLIIVSAVLAGLGACKKPKKVARMDAPIVIFAGKSFTTGQTLYKTN